jgi:hypothetical protein
MNAGDGQAELTMIARLDGGEKKRAVTIVPHNIGESFAKACK